MRIIAALPNHRDQAPASAGAPWSAAVNATTEVGEIAVTLLAVDVVDDQLCLTGAVREAGRAGEAALGDRHQETREVSSVAVATGPRSAGIAAR